MTASRLRDPAGLLLLGVLVFQTTTLPDTLSLHLVSRVTNAVWLAVFAVLAGSAYLAGRFRRTPTVYTAAAVLVIVGLTINLFRNLSIETLGYSAALLPWLAVLSVPFMRSYSLELSWTVYYRFLIIVSAIAVFEYAAVSMGALAPTTITTDRGVFLKGFVTLLYGLDDGSVNNRLYGVFAEPGTCAMFLLPAMAYALVFSRRAALVLFLVALFLTRSLGGAFSFGLVVFLFLVWKVRARRAAIVGLTAAGIAIALAAYPLFAVTYQARGLSATVRVSNVTQFTDNLLFVLQQAPLGLPLGGQSLSYLQTTGYQYLGANFEPYYIFVIGGVIAFFGYVAFFGWAAVKGVRRAFTFQADPFVACAFISLLPMLVFVWQRTTIVTTALFAYLYAQPLIQSRVPVPDRQDEDRVVVDPDDVAPEAGV